MIGDIMDDFYPTKFLADPKEAQAYGAGAYVVVSDDFVTLLWIVLPPDHVTCFRLKADGVVYGVDPVGVYIGWNGLPENPSVYYPLQPLGVTDYAFVLWDGVIHSVVTKAGP